MIKTISFIGSGNVATHLAKGIFEVSNELSIKQIFSRSIENATSLAKQVNAEPINQINQLKQVDLLIVSTPDDVIEKVFSQFSNFEGIIAHTSGVKGIDLHGERIAYFYPLQSFRKNKPTNLKTTPFFIDAKQSNDKQDLIKLAEKLSENVKVISQAEKEKLHVAAVFVNNYVNHLFALTTDFLTNENLSFSDLQPIIETTVERAMLESPKTLQTGPAVRNDEQTLAKHLALLAEFEEMKTVYNQLAKSIQRTHK